MYSQVKYSFNIFKNSDLLVGAALLIIFVLFTHVPFFIYLPIPGISMDTFNYFWFAREICLGHLPIINQPHDFPFGYPLFIASLKKLGFNVTSMVFAQTIIYTLSSIWVIYQFSKSIKYGGIVTGLALSIYTFQPYTINFNLRLYMESLYTSGLLLLAANIVWFLRRKNYTSFLSILFCVLWTMLIRPNGILMVSIPLLLIIYSFFQKLNYKLFTLSLIGMIGINMAGNYFFKASLTFGDTKRIEKVIGNLQKRYEKPTSTKDTKQYEKHKQKYFGSAVILFQTYFSNILSPKPSYYYSMQHTNYELLVKQKMPEDINLKFFDGFFSVDTFAPGLRQFLFEGFDYRQFNNTYFANLVDYEHSPKNLWMYSVHLLYELYNKSRTSYLIYIIFWFILFWAIYQRIILRVGLIQYDIILLLCIVHLIPLISLPFIHTRFQSRYIHVSEFIVYLVFFVGIFTYLNSKSVDSSKELTD